MELKIENVSKNFKSFKALNNISIELNCGIYGLLGPNGAGKSTLINLITDNLKRDSGSILWDGEEILKLGKKYRNILGYMPQQQGYYEEYTAAGFLMYIAHLKGLKKKQAMEKVEEMLHIVNMDEHKNKRIGTFSGGMKQRVLLAQALLNDPKILILDEPTAGVDPQERIRIRNFISKIAKDRIVILATHIVSDVEAISDKILLMGKGEIHKQGAPHKLLEDIKDKVYEINIEHDNIDEIQSEYVVSNLRNSREGLVAKIVSDEEPRNRNYKKTIANLEDVYLYYFNEGN
ncbi:MAG: ABC transporter ATP-binding protein [Lachnospiraceae bacterium]|nr:ABC transporter ATP-binding protein [Lachnospiraceae bacterium]